MKIGDKVCCINTWSYTDYNGDKYIYKINHNYEIIDIGKTHINVKCDNDKHVTFYNLKYSGKYTESFDNELFYNELFDNIFISLKEQRKLKLKKLNESRILEST